MHILKKGKIGIAFMLMALVYIGILAAGYTGTEADESARAVSVGDIDYDKLTVKVFKNGNSIVYFSSDSRKTWMEVEGDSGTDQESAYIVMDISWVNSKTDTTVYFKGDKEATALEVTFPKMNSAFKVKFDKAAIDFEFEGYEDATTFIWRKESDYNWQTVPFDKENAAYKAFLSEINALRFKGAKIIFRCDQVIGTGAENVGQRMSKEVKISIPKMANAPSVKVNVKKMILNTKTTMEYFDAEKNTWVACEKNMKVSDIAAKAMYSGGSEGQDVVLKIRTAASEKKAYSKTLTLTIPAQGFAPSFGDTADVKYSYDNGKLFLTFTKASAQAPIDYCVVKEGADFDPSTAKWKTVKANKQVKLAEKSVPDGSKIYIRYTGVAANANKNIELKLPSYYAEYTVAWPKTADSEKDKTKDK